ncbi:MAG: M48 family metalloprotease [Candidatus Omnitrophica bacterium]|nr:M48 family metalloprotease [Candidatus Omnitrophota bacterium]
MRNKLYKIALVFLFSLTLTGCATVGKREYLKANTLREQQLLSVEDEKKFGHYVDAFIRNEFAVLENFGFQAELEEIFYKIVKNCDRDNLEFNLRVLNSKEVNAFAGPGGYVYITTSLLDMMKSKDELAAVLAHEVGHICARHSIKQFYAIERTKTTLSVFSLLAKISSAFYTGDTGLGDITSDLAAFVAVISIQGYSRKDELQADSLGVKYAIKAGYNPLAMIELLEKMEEQAKQKGRKSTFILLSSHPALEVRAENIKRQTEYLRGEINGQ